MLAILLLWVLSYQRMNRATIGDINDAKLKELVADIERTDRRLILRAKNTGAWLNVRGTTLTGRVLSAT